MAIVTRRYVLRGPQDSRLALFVGGGTAFAAAHDGALVDINVDDAIPDLISTLDVYLTGFGFEPTATASPKQVFTYVADGTEGAVIAIGAAEGFLARVTANYNVQVALRRGAASALKLVSVVNGTLTVNSFSVELSAPVEAGDVLMFTVEDL
jgi:hypothetical protein